MVDRARLQSIFGTNGSDSGETLVLAWWAALSVVGCVNIMLSLWRYSALSRNQRTGAAIVGVIYSICCAFRSIWPRIDVERVCLWDTPLSYITIGRTVATIAEVSFGYQLTLVVASLATVVGARSGQQAGWSLGLVKSLLGPSIVWLSAIANTSCWIAVITKYQLFHAFEEFLWLIIGLVLLSSFLIFARHQPPKEVRTLLNVGSVITFVYVLFMLFIDVPMYIHKWSLDEANPAQVYLSLLDGLIDSFSCTVDRSFAFWGKEMPWLSGYFTVAVWASIYLMKPFHIRGEAKKQKGQ